jgi:hypothetical protein
VDYVKVEKAGGDVREVQSCPRGHSAATPCLGRGGKSLKPLPMALPTPVPLFILKETVLAVWRAKG